MPRGWDRFQANLIEALPADAAGIVKFIRVMRDLGGATDRLVTPGSLGAQVKFAASAGLSAIWAMQPLSRLLEACDLSSEARTVLTTQASYLTAPHRAATIVHAGFLNNYISDGGYFPAGGGQVLSAHLASVITAHGGQWRTNARVKRILVESGRVAGVELDSGERISSDVVVSNADLKRTLLELVGPEHLPRHAVKRADSHRMSTPLVNVYLALDIDLRGQIPVTNYFSVPTMEPSAEVFDLGERAAELDEPTRRRLLDRTPGFVSVQSVKDPDCARIAPPGYTNLEIMSGAPSDYAYWGVETGPYNGGKYRRGTKYQERKEEFTEMLIDRAEAVIPGVREHIVWQEAATPITQERYSLSTDGVAYGIDLSWQQMGPLRPTPRTSIKGLFLASASNSWGPGVEGAMAAGVGAAGAVLRRNLAAEIRSGLVLSDRSALPFIAPDWDPLMQVGGPKNQRWTPELSVDLDAPELNYNN